MQWYFFKCIFNELNNHEENVLDILFDMMIKLPFPEPLVQFFRSVLLWLIEIHCLFINDSLIVILLV